MTRIAVAVAAILVSFCASACHSASSPRSDTPPRIELKRISADLASVEVAGLSPGDLSALSASTLTPDDWTALLRITVGDTDRADDRPAVLGTYTLGDGVLRFTPRFPFD